VSIKESPGFLDAFNSVEGDNILLIPGSASKKLLSAAFTSYISSHSKFISSIADWYALRIDDDTPLCFNGTAYYPSIADLQSSLTLANSCSSQFTLTVMSCVSLLIPFVLAYIVYAWRQMDKKKITQEEIKSSSDIY
jgi:hypothetical protein